MLVNEALQPVDDEPNPEESIKRPYRVLSIDGGGMRGLYTSTFMQSLASAFAKPPQGSFVDIGKAFDLIVGTSTGGILACALACGIDLNHVS